MNETELRKRKRLIIILSVVAIMAAITIISVILFTPGIGGGG